MKSYIIILNVIFIQRRILVDSLYMYSVDSFFYSYLKIGKYL